jgi:superkiller protein 3
MKKTESRDKERSDRADAPQGVAVTGRPTMRWFLYVAAVICLGVATFFVARRALFPPEHDRGSRASQVSREEEPKPQTADELKAEGLRVARQLIQDFPGTADPVLLMGQVFYRNGDSSEAITCWEEGLNLAPNRADVYDGMAWIALRKGDYETAISHWRKALKIQPNMASAYTNLGKSLMALGKVDEAVEALEKGIGIAPRSPLSQFLLGQGYLQLGKPDKAKEAYERAIALDPDHTNAYYGLARALTSLGERERAKECTETFRRLKAKDMENLKDRNAARDDLLTMRSSLSLTHEDAAQVYRKHGEVQQAESHLRRAVFLDPAAGSSRLNLASLYESMSRIPEAIREYEAFRKIEPANPMGFLALASLHSRSGRFVDAERMLKQLLEIDPNSALANRDLARLYLKFNKRIAEAKALAVRAVEIDPIAANYDVLGWAYYANGDMAESLSAARLAMELDPDDPSYKRRYEQILQRMGEQ